MMAPFVRTPLWPAGHLPHREGDPSWQWRHSISPAKELARPSKRGISLLVGEMAGRPEGGAMPCVDLEHPSGDAPWA